ncbi:MAG: MFS transporter [Tepidisphaeraceae bacterium]
MLRRLFSISVDRVPYLSRASYVRELRTAATYPVAVALTEGAFASVVAQKYFGASALLASIIVAAPMFGNIAALVWSDLARGKRRIAFANRLQIAEISCVFSVALTYLLPKSAGAWLFAALIVGARVIASGIVTIRSVVWRSNYPQARRAQIVSRIVVNSTLAVALAGAIGSALVEKYNWLYVIVYAVAGVLAIIGMRQFGRIRIRGEGRLIRSEIDARRDEADSGRQIGPIRRFANLFVDAHHLLRDDPQFRAYQRWQMFTGSSFLMMLPCLYTMVNKELTDPNRDYFLATTIVSTMPTITQMAFTRVWAPLFDRIRFANFRFLNGLVALVTHMLVAAGALTGQLWVVALATFVLGVSQAAGSLAWNLGQNAFAPPNQVQRYMGVHVMLTGLRGCFAPFIGTLIYAGLATYGQQRWMFFLPMFACAIGVLGFLQMTRGEAARNREIEPPVPEPADIEPDEAMDAASRV